MLVLAQSLWKAIPNEWVVTVFHYIHDLPDRETCELSKSSGLPVTVWGASRLTERSDLVNWSYLLFFDLLPGLIKNWKGLKKHFEACKTTFPQNMKLSVCLMPSATPIWKRLPLFNQAIAWNGIYLSVRPSLPPCSIVHKWLLACVPHSFCALDLICRCLGFLWHSKTMHIIQP